MEVLHLWLPAFPKKKYRKNMELSHFWNLKYTSCIFCIKKCSSGCSWKSKSMFMWERNSHFARSSYHYSICCSFISIPFHCILWSWQPWSCSLTLTLLWTVFKASLSHSDLTINKTPLILTRLSSFWSRPVHVVLFSDVNAVNNQQESSWQKQAGSCKPVKTTTAVWHKNVWSSCSVEKEAK